MEEIVSKRQKGFINLNEYFNDKLGTNVSCHDVQSLYEHGLIEVEATGISDKFWIIDSVTTKKIALFKEQNSIYMCYSELFSEEIAKLLNFETAHYDLATLNGHEGVISYNFLKDKENYLSGFDLICDYYEEKIFMNEEIANMYNINLDTDTIDEAFDKLNNLDSIWSIVEERYKNNHNKRQIVFNIMDKIVDKLMFDILTVNIDDHSDNWALVNNRLAPLFDNERIINMHNKNKNEGEVKKGLKDKELLLTVDERGITKPLEVLKYFLNISSSEYRDRFESKLNKLEINLEYIPNIIEKRIMCEIPKDIKNYFLDTMNEHLSNVSMTLNETNKGSK